jgi:hypothetical protein
MITNFAELNINQYVDVLAKTARKAKLLCGGPGFKGVEAKQSNTTIFKSFNALIKAVETLRIN